MKAKAAHGRGARKRAAPKNVTEFLKAVTPAGVNGTLLAFDPSGDFGPPVEGLALTSETLDRVAPFVKRHTAHNLYWSPNPPKGPLTKKAKKADIAEMRWVHLDIDQLGDEVLGRIQKYRVPPTMVVCSGGGFNVYWKLAEPIHANGNIDELERANKTVMAELKAEKGTHNLDRILRLPFTKNYPTPTKLRSARKPVDAVVVDFHPERAYSLDAFDPLEALPDSAPKPAAAPVAATSSKHEGTAGDGSRSADLLRKIAEDARTGLTDEALHVKYSTHPHAVDQSDPARAVQRYIDKVRKEDSDVVGKLNAEHGLIFIDGRLLVIWPKVYDEGLPRVSKVQDIKVWWRPHQRGKTSPVDVWLGSRMRRTYSGFTFRPGAADTGDKFNLFRGWGVVPDPAASCALFLAHLRDVVCSGEADVFDYVVQWFANAVQTPEDKPGTALALASGQGAGKGTIAEYIGPIFGHHLARLSGSDQLLGRFNDTLAGKLMVFGDEAAWPGDRRGIDKLKSYITERRITVERKHVSAIEIDNHCRFVFATNNSHSAPVEIDDRRFVVLNVSNSRINDFDYWNALTAERCNGGPAAFLHYLLSLKLTRNLRITPKTAALTENKLMSLDDVGAFVRYLLLRQSHRLAADYDPRLPANRFTLLEFGKVTTTALLHRFYLDFAKRNNVRYVKSLDALGIAMRRYLVLTKREARGDEKKGLGLTGQRPQVYALPTLAEARKQFEVALGGQSINWEQAMGGGK